MATFWSYHPQHEYFAGCHRMFRIADEPLTTADPVSAQVNQSDIAGLPLQRENRFVGRLSLHKILHITAEFVESVPIAASSTRENVLIEMEKVVGIVLSF